MNNLQYKNMRDLTSGPMVINMQNEYEVPDTHIVASPGGLSSIHHHPTGGMYGHGNSTSDHYGPSDPAYPSGNYGSMYDRGHTAGQDQGYYPPKSDPQYWDNQDTFEFIEQPDIEEVNKKCLKLNVSPFVLLLLFLLAFVSFTFVAEGAKGLISEKFHNSKAVPWHWMFIYALIALGSLTLISYFLDIPLTIFEDV